MGSLMANDPLLSARASAPAPPRPPCVLPGVLLSRCVAGTPLAGSVDLSCFGSDGDATGGGASFQPPMAAPPMAPEAPAAPGALGPSRLPEVCALSVVAGFTGAGAGDKGVRVAERCVSWNGARFAELAGGALLSAAGPASPFLATWAFSGFGCFSTLGGCLSASVGAVGAGEGLEAAADFNSATDRRSLLRDIVGLGGMLGSLSVLPLR